MAGSLTAIYQLVLRHQVGRNRVLMALVLTALSLLLGFTVVRTGQDPQELALQVVTEFGLRLALPVICLLLGSAALGEWIDDETMVYVWLRPVPRWVIALGAYLAVITVCLPLNLIPLFASTIAGGVTDGDVLLGTVVATSLATVAYCSVFLLLGVVIRKALAVGLIYVFVWEFTLAGLFPKSARFSISSYAATALAKLTGLELELRTDFVDRATWASWAIPLIVAVVGVALTAWRLDQADVA